MLGVLVMKKAVIVNPSAGWGSAGRKWPELESRLKSLHGEFETHFTRGPGDAVQITRRLLLSGTERLFVVGGDGTVNESLNGWLVDDQPVNPKAELGIFMLGSGCDLQRSLKLETAFSENRGEGRNSSGSRLIDVLKITFRDERDGSCVRYCVNIASLGLSGAVDQYLHRHNGWKWIGGRLLFLTATLTQVLNCPQSKVTVKIDEDPPLEFRTRLVAVANGQFFGGGMQVAPEAVLDDGQMDVIWLEEMKLGTFLRHLPKVYSGRHLGVAGIQTRRAQKVEVQSSEDIWLDIDGESPGRLDASFEILPGRLKVLV